jgi:hypothetical protein
MIFVLTEEYGSTESRFVGGPDFGTDWCALTPLYGTTGLRLVPDVVCRSGIR